jgi:hypothetical protein
LWYVTLTTNSKYPTSVSNVVGVYGLITSSPRLSFPLHDDKYDQNESIIIAWKLKSTTSLSLNQKTLKKRKRNEAK